MRTLIFALVVFLSACSTPQPIVYEPPAINVVRLSVPPEPDLPTISVLEISCVTNAAYARLIDRDVMQRQYIKSLQDIIRATQ